MRKKPKIRPLPPNAKPDINYSYKPIYYRKPCISLGNHCSLANSIESGKWGSFRFGLTHG